MSVLLVEAAQEIIVEECALKSPFAFDHWEHPLSNNAHSGLAQTLATPGVFADPLDLGWGKAHGPVHATSRRTITALEPLIVGVNEAQLELAGL